jgi:branched-chain amino acid transport system substrate-binding protein
MRKLLGVTLVFLVFPLGLGALILGDTSPTHAAPVKDSDSKVYEFGAMFPMTGPAAFIGECFTAGVKLAVDEINAKGGINGVKIKATIEDHQATPAGGVNAINKIILNKNIAYTLGSFVDPNLSAQPIAQRNKVLIMNSGGLSDSLLNKPYLYNNQVMPSYQMPALAQYLYEQGFRKVATLVNDGAEGTDNRKFFVNTWQKLGGTVVASEVFQLDKMDFSTQLTKIKAARPDLVYIVATALHAATALKQIKELGITAPPCGMTLDDPAVVGPAGANAEGLFAVGPYLDTKSTLPYARAFIDTYNQKYAPKGATAYWPWANAYENVHIYAELVKKVEAKGGNPLDGSQLLQALEANRSYPSVFGSGTLTFTEDHQVIKAVGITTIKGGSKVPLKIILGENLRK